MSDDAQTENWVNLQVVHFDSYIPEVDLRDATPLAPWHTWVQGFYHQCRQSSGCLDQLQSSDGPVILLLHFTDLLQATPEFCEELSTWLAADPAGREAARPTRQIFVYTASWGFGNNSSDVGNRLPPEEYGRRWTTVPTEHLESWACPVGWLGHVCGLGLTLQELSGHFEGWRERAIERLVITSRGDEAIIFERQEHEGPFLRRLCRVELSEVLLTHDLRYGHNNSRVANNRSDAQGRLAVFRTADSLWALYCVCGHLRWTRCEQLLQDVLAQIANLLQRGISLADSQAHAWQDVGHRIERLLDEARPDSNVY